MKARRIIIEPVLNGFQVEVGCQKLAFHDKGKMVSELERYLENPEAVTKEYLAKFEPIDGPCAAPTPEMNPDCFTALQPPTTPTPNSRRTNS